MKQSKTPSAGLFTIGIAALFLLGFLLLVIFGAQTSRNTVNSQYGNNDTRAVLSYLSAVVKANDVNGAVSVEETDGMQVLVLEDSSGYAMRIYCRDGYLLEDYAPMGSPLDPENAQQIAPNQVFEVSMIADFTWRIVTDEGENILHLRSAYAAPVTIN